MLRPRCAAAAAQQKIRLVQYNAGCRPCLEFAQTVPIATRLPAALLSLVLQMTAPGAFAARPFVTDDARLVDPGGCQIETFIKRQRNFGEREAWFLPGCNPGGNLELTFGGLNVRNDADGRASTLIAQGKTLLRPLHTNDYGVALTLGAARQSQFAAGAGSPWSPYLNLISSISMRDDALVVHANAGALDDRTTGVTRPTWGIGAELLVAPRLYAIAESYGQKGDKPSQQVGLRYWLVPEHVQVDGTLGTQRSGPPGRSWMSLGLRLLF